MVSEVIREDLERRKRSLYDNKMDECKKNAYMIGLGLFGIGNYLSTFFFLKVGKFSDRSKDSKKWLQKFWRDVFF